jgi:hypothetical protein
LTREEFEAVLALEDVYELHIRHIKGRKGNGRYCATLMYKDPEVLEWAGDKCTAFGSTVNCAIEKLIASYI